MKGVGRHRFMENLEKNIEENIGEWEAAKAAKSPTLQCEFLRQIILKNMDETFTKDETQDSERNHCSSQGIRAGEGLSRDARTSACGRSGEKASGYLGEWRAASGRLDSGALLLTQKVYHADDVLAERGEYANGSSGAVRDACPESSDIELIGNRADRRTKRQGGDDERRPVHSNVDCLVLLENEVSIRNWS